MNEVKHLSNPTPHEILQSESLEDLAFSIDDKFGATIER